MFFDIARNSLGCASMLLRLSIMIDIIRTETLQFHMWTPDTVPAPKLVILVSSHYGAHLDPEVSNLFVSDPIPQREANN